MVTCRLRESFRQPEAIFWTFVFPVLLAVALGVAFRGKPDDAPIRVAVVRGAGADSVLSALSATGAVKAVALPPGEAERQLRGGIVAIVVAPGVPTAYRFDPTRPESALARTVVDGALQRAAGRRDPIVAVDRPVTLPGSRYIDFLVPGLLGMNLMGGGVWGIGWVIVEMRIRRLLKLQLTTPMRRSHFLLSHILSRLVFVPMETVPLLLLAGWIFDVRTAGSLATLAAMSVAGAFAFAGIGTLVASRAQSSNVVMGLINLVTLPSFVLSGVFFSTSRFPESVQPLLRLLPLTALVDGLRAVMTEGASAAAVMPRLVVLLGWSLVSFLLALKLFRWS
jgi:ABC-type multidrug transport system permease subunit